MRIHVPSRRGFTLVEILIVVIILGILAAIVLPQFSNASETARQNTLKEDLRFMRSELQLYRAQHSAYPQLSTFTAQLTQVTDEAGNTSSFTGTKRCGPYLSRMPQNPLTGSDVVADLNTPTETAGWLYDQDTGTFKVNADGTDITGTPFANY